MWNFPITAVILFGSFLFPMVIMSAWLINWKTISLFAILLNTWFFIRMRKLIATIFLSLIACMQTFIIESVATCNLVNRISNRTLCKLSRLWCTQQHCQSSFYKCLIYTLALSAKAMKLGNLKRKQNKTTEILLFTSRIYSMPTPQTKHFGVNSKQTHLKSSRAIRAFIEKLKYFACISFPIFFLSFVWKNISAGNAPWWNYCAFSQLLCCACITLCFGWVKPFYTISTIFCRFNSAYLLLFYFSVAIQTFWTRWLSIAVKVLNCKLESSLQY